MLLRDVVVTVMTVEGSEAEETPIALIIGALLERLREEVEETEAGGSTSMPQQAILTRGAERRVQEVRKLLTIQMMDEALWDDPNDSSIDVK